MIVAVFDTFGAIVVLLGKSEAANPLSISSLSGSIMFNPKERVLYNAIPTRRHSYAVTCAFFV